MRATRGFTFIEIVVTLGIIATTLIFYAIAMNTVVLARATKNDDLALHIVNQKIEALRGAGYSALPTSGPFTDTQLSSLPSGAASTTISTYNASTKQVTVTVTWQDPGKASHIISLSTLITQIGGL